MIMRVSGLVGGAYKLPSVAADCQRCVNLYAEINESGSAKDGEKGFLETIPGNRPALTLNDGPVRGLFTVANGDLYAVSGTHLFRIDVKSEIKDCGELLTSTSPVSMVDNPTQLALMDGAYGYTYTFASSTLARITDDGFYPGPVVEFLDTYGIVPRSGSQEYHFSASNDFVNWNALDFGVAEGSPDNLVTLKAYNRQLWLFGTKTLEIHYNTGAVNTPFERVPGGLLQMGCASPYCVQIVGNSILWLDSSQNGNGIVWKSTGLTPSRVSTHAIEKELQQYDLSNAFTWSYQDGGHAFYCISIPNSESTWCYDLATGLWSERVSVDEHSREQVSRISCHAFAYGKHFVGDAVTGDLYVMDRDYHLDGTSPLIWKRSTPHVSGNLKRIFFHSFELDAETGVGLDSGQGSDPKVFLRYSSDRGHTWSPPVPRSLGAGGNYKGRVRWLRLGNARDRVFEISGSDPVPTRIFGAVVEVEAGNS